MALGRCNLPLLPAALLATAFLAGTIAAEGQDDRWVGRKFMPREGCRPMAGGLEFPVQRLSLPYVVQKVEGDRLSLGRVSVKKAEVVALEQAAAYYSECLENDPAAGWARNYRGVVRGELGEIDKALEDFTESIRLDPGTASAFGNRGRIWYRQRAFDKALKDFTEAIRLDPFNASVLSSRGHVWKQKGQFEKALQDYSESIRLDRLSPEAYNGRAWLWATASDAQFRDGKRAVESATKACELSQWADENYLDTLAAAYAEAGDFVAAIKWQKEAVKLVSEERKADFKPRIELYQSRKPFREEPSR